MVANGLEFGPMIAVGGLLAAKLLYFSLALHDASWGTQEPLGLWVRAHPQMFTATVASLLFLLAPVLVAGRIPRYLILIIIDFLLSTLILADVLHLRWYGDLISIASFPLIPQLGRVANSVFRELRLSDAFYYIDVLIGVVLFPLYVRHCRLRRVMPKRNNRRIVGLAVLLASLLFVPSAVLMWRDGNGLFAYRSHQREVCAVVGLLPYHLLDAQFYARWRLHRVDKAEREQVSRFLQTQLPEPVDPTTWGAARGRNVIMISAESLHGFPLDLTINGVPVTPRLSKFRAESMNFENFYDQTHLGTTSDAQFMALNSLYPSANGAVTGEYRSNKFHSLPTILSLHGYSTLVAVGAESDLWRMKEMNPRYGFQRGLYKEDYKMNEVINSWLSDKQFFAQSIPQLNALPKPFFALLFSSTNHHPFDLPPSERRLPLGELTGTVLGNYLNTVHYFDQAFGEFIDELQATGLLDQSLVVLYGDHRAFLDIRPETAQQMANFFSVPEWNVYRRTTIGKKLPFLIHFPQGQHARNHPGPGGHMDISPTLLTLLGINRPTTLMLGRDLISNQDGLVAFRDGSFIDAGKLFINRFGPISNCICYELRSGRDLNCHSFEAQRNEVRMRLEVSDLILQGDLIPYLQGQAAERSADAQPVN